jgi:predicted metalloendopeptidase
MAHLDRLDVPVPLGGYVDPDVHDPGHYAFWLSQGGLGLPDRDYYLSGEAKLAEIRTAYRRHLVKMLSLAGLPEADKRAEAILSLETRIAAIEWKAVDRRDPGKTYNPRGLAELARMMPAVDWKAYFAEQHLPARLPVVIAREPDYFTALSGLFETTPLPVWKDYLRLRLLSAAAPYLPKALAEEEFAFAEGVLHGTPVMPERWKRGCELIDQLLGEAGGKLYVERYFPPESRRRAGELVHNLLAAYEDGIRSADWMGGATRAEALAKLAALRVKIGYPDHWRDYGALVISPADLLGNVLRAKAFEADRKRAQTAGPVDRDEWSMTAPTVDAYYEPGRNEIALPAGILQPPLFDPEADDAYNYGSTGATIGHEISHGFDNRGSRYDAKGDLRDWWTAEDRRAYEAQTVRIVRQFDKFEPIPGIHVDGALTLSENIADLAGLEIAHAAYRKSLDGREAPVIDGLTGEQRFFLGYAQSYLGKRREELLMAQLKSNPHPPERYRVNGLVAHMQAFYDAFGAGSGDGMYLPPEERAVLWK